jgi:Uma2 family endonuclease
MTIAISIPRIQLAPGSKMSISGVSWSDFEEILLDLGEKRTSRITYYQGNLEIMSPLARHVGDSLNVSSQRPHRIMAYIVTTILAAQARDWEDFGSTTLKLPEIAGIEPDTCFYIANASQVRNCTNLNLADYPPPDLAIECDVTSKTTIDVYQALQVPEVWIYQEGQLTIYHFASQGYQISTTSQIFPELPIVTLVPQLVQRAIAQGTSSMLKELQATLSSL